MNRFPEPADFFFLQEVTGEGSALVSSVGALGGRPMAADLQMRFKPILRLPPFIFSERLLAQNERGTASFTRRLLTQQPYNGVANATSAAHRSALQDGPALVGVL